MNYDTVVVGVGLAGLTAGLRLAEGGQRVLLLARGIGATHLGGHTVDVLGYAPDRVDGPGRALPGFAAEHPEHPYARLSPDVIAESIEWFRSRLEAYPFAGTLEENLLLPTAVGVPKPTALVPETMAAGDLRQPGPLLFAGFRALKDFYPAYLAENVARATEAMGIPSSTRAVELSLTVDGERDVSALAFARRLDEDLEFRKELIRELEPHVRSGERVGVPALLGLNDAVTVWRELQDGLGCPVFEVPTLPPSVPGIRLYQVLKEAIRRRGGRIVLNTPIVGVESRQGRVEAVRAESAARPVSHRASSFVLASGGFASRGLETDSHGNVRETVFGLPVAGVPAAGRPRFGPGYLDEHPMSRTGVAVDDDLRPVDAEGGVVYENVFVAGATLGGAEPWREKSGNGISLATGYRAAQAIERMAR